MRRTSLEEAEELLEGLDGRRYGAYRRLYGVEIEAPCGVARFTRIQGDPYATPSVLEVRGRLGGEAASLPSVPVADYAYRLLQRGLKRVSRKRGSGHSGFLGVPRPSNAMLRRSGFEVKGGVFTARLWFGLPARGRRILGDAAAEMLRDAVGVVCRVASSLRGERLRRHVETYLVQEELRGRLGEKRLAAFIGDGSILPRRCSGCEEPLEDAVPFESPPSLRVELEARGRVYTGMGVPRGFTVITGHVFHGKTTLLEAIAYGVYNHVPGDGRELVVSDRRLAWVEAEDGRVVRNRDISPLVHRLPRGDPRRFTSLDASGATSMAASIVEALEAGARLLLIDEDRAATNLLDVDDRLVERLGEPPVTPLRVYARCLSRLGISTVIVTGALGRLADAAETLIVMHEYRPVEAERRGGSGESGVECRLPEERPLEAGPLRVKPRPPLLVPRAGRPVSLASNRVLVEEGQYRLIALMLGRRWSGRPREIAERFEEMLDRGFEALVENPPPDLAEVRGIDLVYALARL